MLYLAYGSNLHRGQMKFRCPLAKPLGKVLVPDFRLVFRGVADIEEYKGGASCPMGLWEISDACKKFRYLRRFSLICIESSILILMVKLPSLIQ